MRPSRTSPRSADIVALAGLLVLTGCTGAARMPGAIPPARTPLTASGEGFAWSANRQLAWPDFRGQPDPDSTATAVTAYALTYDARCEQGILAYRIESRFLPDESWVKLKGLDSRASDFVLRHERGHFDLSEVQARRARLALSTLNDPCALDDDARDRLVTPFFTEDAATQARYDRETAHGTDRVRQDAWEEQIRDWLRELPALPATATLLPPASISSATSPPVAPAALLDAPSPLDAIVGRAADYVKDYQRALTEILADEEYEQQILSQVPEEPRMPRRRRTQSEVFFLFAGDWMAMRDVLTVNGSGVKDRPNLRAALATLPTLDVARQFKDYNSRYNLGRIVRNFNEPTLSLLFLDDRYRYDVKFEWKGIKREQDGEWVTVAFAELPDARGLIVDLSGQPAPSRGEFQIHAGTGRIRLAQMTTTIGAITAELTTRYEQDDKLGILVPTTFTERYVEGAAIRNASDPRMRMAARYEEVQGRAEYRNYRRFEVKVIIR